MMIAVPSSFRPFRTGRLFPTGRIGRGLLVASALMAAGCGDGSGEGHDPARAGKDRHPVVLIGVDGLDPYVVGELLEEGRLPNLARFVEAGTVGQLRTMSPTLSPVLWTTIATGQKKEQHGVVDFQDGTGRPFTSNARRVPALWDILSERGRRVNCVGWWVTWPAEAILGNMVASYAAQAQASVVWKPGTWKNLPDQTYPPGLADAIEPLMIFARDADEIRARLWSCFERPSALDKVMTDSVTVLGWTYAADLSFAAISAELLREEPADLHMVYMALPDVAGHRFWSYHQPEDFNVEISPAKLADFSEYVKRAYEESDRLIGTILDAAPEDANILLLSDHGMHAFDIALDDPERPVTGNHGGDIVGTIAAMGPEIRAAGNLIQKPGRGPLGGLLEVAPLVLRLLGEAVPDHWPRVEKGIDLERLLDPDWSAAHPMQVLSTDDAWFRAPTESLLPGNGLDRKFIRSFQALGYALSEPEDEGD